MVLTFTVDLPPEIERQFRDKQTDLATYAKESLAVQLFREGRLSHLGLGRALSLDRVETDALLKRYQVEEHGLTHEDIEADVQSLNDLLGPRR
jgi:predicted HTH domain antitoxin